MVGVSSAAFAQAVNLGGTGNSIVPDGRTATGVTVQGRVTSIRSSTFAGGNAYNSFSTFSEGAGNTVNLYVPDNAGNLVNIVRNAPVNIQGTLNSYKNGQIGGNVVFADSYGFVVGAKGVVNVGGLTVVTPNRATIEGMIDRNGHVNGALAAAVIAGTMPLSADGSVVIKGQVNAAHFVRITAHDVQVAGSMAEAKKVAMRRAEFESTVNTTGLAEGGAIVVRNGAISIVASNDATIGGRLSAGGTSTQAGRISVAAAHNVTIASTASLTSSARLIAEAKHAALSNPGAPSITISAGDTTTIAGTLTATTVASALPGEIGVTGTNISIASTAKLVAEGVGSLDGGHVSVKATDATTVAAGASFLADALGTGNGGFVEISGQTDNVSPDIEISLGAASAGAHSGTLLFDPDVLIIGATAQSQGLGDTATVSTTGSLYTNGANVELDANNSITIAGVIDTRMYANDTTSGSQVAGLLAAKGVASTGNSGSITLSAPTITIASGGALYADVYNATSGGTAMTGWRAGAVSLAGQTIAIDGTVAGGAISSIASGTIDVAGSVFGGPTVFSAATKITIEKTGVVDTRALDPTGTVSIADSQSIDFTAPTITAATGSLIRAAAINTADTGFQSGAVDFDAAPFPNGSVDAGGSIAAGSVAFDAGSTIKLDATSTITTSKVAGSTGSVTLDAPSVVVTTGAAISAADVAYQLQQQAVIIGDPTADGADAGAAGFVSNQTIAGYAVALGGSGTLELTALGSIKLDPHAAINPATSLALALAAPMITLSGGSTLGGGAVTLTAPTIAIDAASTNGARITAQSLTLVTTTLDLTSTPDLIVGDALKDGNATAAGFVSNQTIATYLADLGGSGLLEITGSSSITLDPSGLIDTRQVNNGSSTGNSLSVVLQAPTITLASGSAIHAEALNTNGSTFIPGVVELDAVTSLTVDGSVSGGEIDVRSPSLSVAQSVFSAASVDFDLAATDVTIGAAGVLSNAAVAGLVASLSGTTGFELSASDSITLASGGVIDTGSKTLALTAPKLTLAAGSTLSGGAIVLNAGPNGTIGIDADSAGGATIGATAGLQFNAATLDLTTAAQSLTVGNQSETAANAQGFVKNQTIQTYVAAMGGTGALDLTASNAITVDGTGVVDSRQIAAGASATNSLSVTLDAPTVTIAAGGQILAQAVNNGGTTYSGGGVAIDASGIDVAGTIRGANIALNASANAITLEGTALIDARQLDSNGNATGPAFAIVFQAPSISVAGGASLYGSSVGFGFTESSLTLSGDKKGQTGAAGKLSNDIVTSYIAAMNGTGTFVLGVAGTLDLDSSAVIEGVTSAGKVGVALSAGTYLSATGAYIDAPMVSIDPTQSAVVIGDVSDPNATLTNQTLQVITASFPNATQEISISAKGSITLDPTAIIDTRELGVGGMSTRAPLSVSLNAPSITMDKGAQILANAVNAPGLSGGAVTLTAEASVYRTIGAATATADISIDGTIDAGSISATAKATAESVYALNANNTSPGEISSALVGSLLTDLSPFALQPGYVQARATSSVTVGADAVLTATGNITLDSQSTGNASDPAIGVAASGALFAAGVVVGQLDQSATTTIEAGAQINASSLDVAATNNATVDVSSEQISGPTFFKGYGANNKAPAIQIDFAYGEATVDSTAAVESGAAINVSGDGSSVDIFARNDNAFTSSATSDALKGGKVGAAIAIGDFNSSAIAHDGANIGTDGAPVGSVSVVAQSETSKDKVDASTNVGESAVSTLLAGLGVVASVGGGAADASVTPPTFSLLGGLVAGSSKLQAAITAASTYLPQVASSVGVSLGTQASSATISADGATAPTIHASGGVAVISDTTDSVLTTNASSGVNAEAPSASNPASYLTVSAAVTVTLDTQNSSAVVGPNVTIDAGQIGIDATSLLPVPIENIDWTSPTSILNALKANTAFDTTNANAQSASGNLGIAGAVDVLSLTTNTTAWVGTGATLDTTGADGSWTSANLQALDPSATAAIQTTFFDAQSVVARSTVETLNIPADLAGFGQTHSYGGVSVGATVALDFDTATTDAGIAAGATITSLGTVDVDAETAEHMITVTPTSGGLTSGSGTGINLSGIAAVDIVDDTTSASISNDATVVAAIVEVNAHQDLGIYTFSGDITTNGASSVGISFAYAGVTTQTDAFIGDNSNVVGTTIDPLAGTDTTLGSVSAGAVDVTAKTTGNDVVAAIAATRATGNASETPADSGDSDTPSDSAPPLITAADLQPSEEETPGSSKAIFLSGIADAVSKSTTSLSISGSAAYTDTALHTSAYIDNAVVKGTGSAPSVTVEATTNTLIAVGSGSGALAASGAGSTLTAAASAAAAFESSGDSTTAYIESSNLGNVGSVSVEAQSTGLIADVGLGVSVAKPSGETPAGGLAGSASGALVADRVAAYIENSTVTGNASAPGNLVVLADQQTTIAVGGGSFFKGGQGGGGLALTYTDITDPSAGPATDAHISNSSVTTFENIVVVAEAPQAVYSAAAELTSSTVGVGGALVFTIDNATISATIGNTGNTPLPITALDDVDVIAATDPKSLPSYVSAPAIATSVSGAQAATANYYDPSSDTSSANASDAALLTSGSAAILSIAGNVIAGGSNGIGASVVTDTIGVAHDATISGVTLTAPGTLDVSALDSTSILAVGIGIGDTNTNSVQAGVVTNTITSSTTALIGPTIGTTSTAATEAYVGGATVEAVDSSVISAFALIGSASTGSGAAVGVSIASSDIETPATAAINHATVTTDGTFTAASDATGDIVLQGLSTAALNTFAVGVAVSKQASVAGSAVTSIEGSDVTAEVLSSTVFASNDVGVLSSNANAIQAIAGAVAASSGAAGVGVSVTVNEITGSTDAAITSSIVDAQALGTGSLLIVDGALNPNSTASAAAAANPDGDVAPGTLPSLGADVRTDRGLAVVAGSQQTAKAFAVSLGYSENATIVVNTVTTIMGGQTAATVTGSSIETLPTTASSGPAADVAAYSVSYANEDAFNAAVSTSSGLAVAAAATTSTFDRTTEAEVSDTDIGTAASGTAIPAGAVTISANAYEGASTTLVGASVSGDGISATGNVLVDLFKADTEASLLGGTVYAASLSVTANATNGYFAALGTGSGGYDGAGSVSVAVATFKDTTSATVGDPSAQTATTLDLSGPLTIQATSAIDTTSYVVGFSAGGGAGIAAQVAVNDLSDTTLAALDGTDTTISSSPTNGTITIGSTDDVSVTSTVGGLAGSGAVGLGASANVVVLSSANTAEMVGDTVTTPGSVSVEAKEARDVSLITATAALGGSISIAATVGVILVGPEADSDATNTVSGALASAGTAGGVDLSNLGSAADGDSAAILGGSVTANGVTIDATGNLATSNIVGGLALSNGTGAAGVGASVGYTEIGETVSATAAGGTIISNSLAISAVAGDDGSGHAVDSIVFAGAGGAEVSVGGALAFSEDTDSVTAELSSTVDSGTESATINNVPTTVDLAATSVSVKASDTSTIWANAYGAAEGGAGAAGLSVATADRDSTVTAEIATLAATSTNSATTADIVADAVTVQASDAGETYAYALAGAAGGTLAGVGASTTATDNSTVLATVIGASTIVAPDGLTVEATDTPDAKAFTFGVALAAGAAVGASVADAEVTANVTANMDGAVVLVDNDGITDGLSILASTLVDGSPASSFPASTTVPLTTGSFEQGQTNAASWAIAGSGALYLAANGTVSIANDTAKVKAIGGSTATLLALTEGNATVAATNTSDVYAQGTGVSVAGLTAVGAVVVTASASPTTTAELDATTTLYTTSGGSPFSLLGTVNVTATGTDTLNASSLAGSGGLVAGDGSSAATSDTSNVNANIGANSYILATSIDVAAAHTDAFSEMADSINAGAVGASAAISSHDASSNVGVNIGAGATLDATAAGLTACIAGCTPALDITATNDFEDSTSGTSAGAGGGINGAGATSTVTIDNNGEGATITIGAGAILSSGFDPINDPGSLALVAKTKVNITDSDTLTTGGAIEGAGVEAEVRGQINNTVTIGAGADITTAGELDVATYTTGNVTANAYVSTYGVAAVGDAKAYIDLADNQTIGVDTATDAKHPTILNAFGNVNVTAGDYLGQGFQTTFTGTTAAESYVQGLIAVPAADAHSSIASNATLDIATAGSGDAQTSIGAGENVTINADPGTSILASDGTGHGYEAGFVPVTDGSDNTSGPTTSVVTIGAAVVAGEYYDQNVVINSDLSVSVTSGAAVSSASSSSFDMTTFLNTDFAGNTFGGLVATGTVDAVSLGALYASGGVIKIQAATLNGNGSLTAHGAPTITVTDDFPIYLILAGGAYIPNVPGGTITFTGSAGLQAAQSAGMTIDSDNATGTPTITIALTYGATGGVGNSAAGPGLFNTGALTNVGGLIHIINDYGSVASAANVTADSLITYEPNGAYVFQGDDASGNYIAGGSAYSEWASAIVYPGGTPSAGAPNADSAMQYVATAIYERGTFIGSGGTTATDNPASDSSSASIDAALYGKAGNIAPKNNALVLVGACIQAQGSSSCLSSGGYNIADVDGHYGASQQPNYVVETMSYGFSTTANPNPVDNESLTGSTTSQQVYGSYVAIKAATIDINGSITVGKPTTYTADVSASLGTLLDDLKQGYTDIGNFYLFNKDRQAFDTLATRDGFQPFVPALSAALYGASVDITPLVSTSAGYGSLGVSATFNPQSGQISFGNIATFSAGANVKLDGDIVSSNTIGNIHVNSGYGNVSITNESAIPLTFADINTGSVGGTNAATSTVTITNRLIDQQNGSSSNDTTTFIYSPAAGISAYLSSDGAAPLDGSGNLTNGATQLTLPSGSTSTSTTYQTVVGAEFQFVQEALMSRTAYDNGGTKANFINYSDWVFSSGTPNDPWYYINPADISSLPSDAPASSSEISSLPAGRVILSSNVANGVNKDPAFSETITGNTVGTSGLTESVSYTDKPLGFDLSNGQNSYNFYYPTSAFLRLTTTVKADNPFTVGFGGNAQGSVAITSSAGLTFGGTVTNPTGTTTITGPSPGVAAIGLSQTASASFTSNALSIIGVSNVGTSATPLDVTLSPGLGSAVGSLFVDTTGSVNLKLNSGANGVYIASGGSVVVNATGSLQSDGLGFGFNVIGNAITLISSGGSIGSATSLLQLSGVYYEDNVTANVSAKGDIGVELTSGSLLVGQIASTGSGNITIDVPGGNIYSASSQTPASSLSPTQVANVISALNLVGGAGGDAAAGKSSITAFQTLVGSDLSTYATFLASGSISSGGTVAIDDTSATLFSALATSQAVQAARASQSTAAYAVPTTAQIQSVVNTLGATNGVFSLTITPDNLAGYQTQTAAALGITVAGFLPQAAKALGTNATSTQIQQAATALYNTAVANVTIAQIEAWADAKYQAYATTFTQAYGAGWTTNVSAAIQSGTNTYTVAAGSQLATTLTTGASWTPQQLVDAIDVSALQPASANVGSGATANIIGNNVTLTVNGSVGTYDPNGISISLADLSSGNLSSQQQAAIAVATTPGSVLLVGTLNGQPLPAGAQIGSLPSGAVVTGVALPQEQPLFVAAQGAFTITSGAAVYLQGTKSSSITLNTLSAQSDVDVTAPGSILSAASAGAINISAPGNIDLIAGTGSIGTATSPITIQNSVTGAATVLTNASAGTDVNLDVVGGDADLQRVFAGGTASISTGLFSSIVSNLPGINIEAQNIVLKSGGDIGADGTPLDVLTTGTLTGSALESANISATTPAGAATANDLTVGNLNVGASLSLEADGILTIAAGSLVPSSSITVQTGNNAVFSAGTFVMAQGSKISAGETIVVNSNGDATLGALNATLASSTGPSVEIVAGGSIRSNADGLDVTTLGTLSLSAATGIGSAATPLHVVGAPSLAASVTGVTGSIVIDDDSALVVTEISAPTSISLTAASMNLPAISTGAITLSATGDITTVDLTATVGDIDVTSSSGQIATTTVTANGSASLSAASEISGISLTTRGAASLIAGTATDLDPAQPALLSWDTVQAGTTFEAEAYGGTIQELRAVTSGGTQTIGATIAVNFTTLTATSGDIDVTGASIDGTTLTATAGAATLTSTGRNVAGVASIDVVAVGTGSTFGADAQQGGILFGSATSGGTQTISAATTIDYTTLKATAGDIDLTSAGSIAGVPTGAGQSLVTDSLVAEGSFDLQGATTVSANALTAATGSGVIGTGGAVTIGTVAAATTLGVTSTSDAVKIGSATSGGPQMIGAATAVNFTTLTAAAGDVDVTGASIDGTTLTATVGAAQLTSTGPDAAGVASIDVTTISAATTLGATAKAGGIILGKATSASTQTIVADTAVAFTQLTTMAGLGGDIDVTSRTASVQGGSVSADGSASLNSVGSNTGGSVVATDGSVTLTAGSLAAPSALASIDWTTARAGTTLDATSGGALTLTNATSGTTGADGVQTIHASGAINLTTVLATAGTLGVTSDASSVRIDNATSGGTQTLAAAQGVTFRTLTATLGNIDVTGASILGTSTSSLVPALTTDTGSVMLTSTGPDVVSGGTILPSIDVTTIAAATTLGVTAEVGGILLGTATSGGTQTIVADTAVMFTQLTTMAGLGGDIDVTSRTASVQGGSVSADGSASLVSVGSNTGGSVVARDGSVTLVAGSLTTPNISALIDWTTAQAGTTLDATSGGALTLTNATSGATGADGVQTIHASGAINLTAVLATAGTLGVTSDTSSIVLGSATSDATQTIVADTTVAFTQLTTTAGLGGDIDVTSRTASVQGGSVSADGSASLISVGSNTGGSVVATNGSVTLTAGSLAAPNTSALIDWTKAQAGTTLDATSGGALTLTNATSGTTGVDGVQTIHASGAINLTTVLATAGTLGVTSDASSVTIDNATSGGTQTLAAAQGITFRTLTATLGDIDVTGASISGTSTSSLVPALTTDTGSVMLTSTGPDVVSGGTILPSIDVTTIAAATTLGATAKAGGILLGTATSGGTQTIEAKTALDYTSLTSRGGDIDLTSDTASIAGLSPDDTLDAHGSFTLAAATTISATQLMAETGSGSVTGGGLVALGTTATKTTLGIQSTGAGVTLGSATSGGTQTIVADAGDVMFTQLTTTAGLGGDIAVTSRAGEVEGGSVLSDGSASLVSVGSNKGGSVVATDGSVMLTAGSLTRPSSSTRLQWTTAQAGTTLDATSGGALTLTNATSGTTGANGVQTIHASKAINLTTVLATAGTLGVTSDVSSIVLGSATSDATQTIVADTSVMFTHLTTTAGLGGDIDVTSQTGAIQGGSVLADGSASLISVGSNTGGSVVATDGSVTLTAGSLAAPSALASIDWTTARAGTTLDATSGGALTLTNATSGATGADGVQTIHASGAINLTTVLATAGTLGVTSDGSSIVLGSATSGGTQTLAAAQGITFRTLTATLGDIDVTGASISGTSTSSLVPALTTDTGSVMLTSTGPDVVSGGTILPSIDVTTIAAATTLGATAKAGGILLGTATSGGTQTIVAAIDIVFGQLTTTGLPTDPGDMVLTAQTGGVHGGSIDAAGFVTINGVGIDFDRIVARVGLELASAAEIQGNTVTTLGSATVNARGDMDIGSITAAEVALSTPMSISVASMTISSEADLAASNVTVGDLRQAPGNPDSFVMNLTGYRGGIGSSATLFVDAPNGLVIPGLSEDLVKIGTSARQVMIEDAILTETMRLTTPDMSLWFNDVSSQPVLGNNVQLFRPDDRFFFTQDGYVTTTNSYVVQYDASAVIQEDVDGIFYHGSSFIRDIDREGRVGDIDLVSSFDDAGLDGDRGPTRWQFPVDAFDQHLSQIRKEVLAPAPGKPAVNLGNVLGNLSRDGVMSGRSVATSGFKVVFKRSGAR